MLLLSWTAMVGGVEKKKVGTGHLKGVDTVKKIVNFNKVKNSNSYLCFFIRKLKRPKQEISFLFKLIKVILLKK